MISPLELEGNCHRDSSLIRVPRPQQKRGCSGYVATQIQRLDNILGPWLGPNASNIIIRNESVAVLMWAVYYAIFSCVFPPAKDLLAAQPGDLLIFLWFRACETVLGGFFFCYPLCAIVRVGCQRTQGEAVSPSISINASQKASPGLKFDYEVCRIAAKWSCLLLLILTAAYTLLGPKEGELPANFVLWPTLLCLLRREAIRWNPEEARYQMRFLTLRILLIGVPLAMFPIWLTPVLIHHLSVTELLRVYPFILFSVEYLALSVVLKDSAIVRINDQQLAYVARSLTGVISACRVGMLVVITNFFDNFQGLVESVLLSVMLDVVARNNLASVMLHATRYRATVLWQRCWYFFCHPPPDGIPEPKLAVPPLGRMEIAFLSYKPFSDLWPGFMLALMKATGFGSPMGAMDEDTGELRHELDCSWRVILVVVLAVGATRLFGSIVAHMIGKWAPSFKVEVPDEPIQPGDSPVVNVSSWMYVGYACYLGIGGMDHLVPALEAERSFQ